MATTMTDRFGNATPSGSIITTPLIGTSTSSQTVSTSSGLTFSVQTNRAWKPGTRLRVSSTDATKIMEGEVQSYSGSSSLVLEVDYTEGSGSTDSWSLGVAGTRGSSGATGNTGSSGANGAGVATGGVMDDILYKTSTADSATAWRSLSDQIDAVATESTGSILYRASTGWVASAAGTTAQVLFGGAAPVFAAISGAGFNNIVTRVLSTTGNYNPSSFIVFVTVEAIGGGGGGAAGGTGSTGIGSGGGGGGGAGGYSRRSIAYASLLSTEAYVIGAGGAAESSGGNTTFGTATLLTALGGNKGTTGSAQVVGGAGGRGGLGSSGDFLSAGQDGGAGGSGSFTPASVGYGGDGGLGGASFCGGGGRGGSPTNNGSSSQNYGGGGGGGGGAEGSGATGAAGAPGVIIITEYRSS